MGAGPTEWQHRNKGRPAGPADACRGSEETGDVPRHSSPGPHNAPGSHPFGCQRNAVPDTLVRDPSRWRPPLVGSRCLAVMARALVVEDDGAIADAVLHVFRKDGMETALCGTLAAARDALVSGVDLVILDLGLPDGSGFSLL